jgi:hypothetical protein
MIKQLQVIVLSWIAAISYVSNFRVYHLVPTLTIGNDTFESTEISSSSSEPTMTTGYESGSDSENSELGLVKITRAGADNDVFNFMMQVSI